MSEAEKSYAQAIGALEQLALAEKPQSEEWNEIEALKLPCLLNYSQVSELSLLPGLPSEFATPENQADWHGGPYIKTPSPLVAPI